MYKKALSLLLLCNGIVLMGCFCVQEIAKTVSVADPPALLKLEDMEAGLQGQALLKLEDMEARAQGQILPEITGGKMIAGMGIADVTASGQRVVSYSVVEQGDYRFLEEDELDVLRRIVEAEAGNEDEDGRLLVANVVLNRVDSDSFPDTVTEVVFQRSKGVTQFSPVASGRIHTVEVSEETIEAVDRALAGEDISQGALYFAARRYASSRKMRWFDEKLTFLFRHGGHEFYK